MTQSGEHTWSEGSAPTPNPPARESSHAAELEPGQRLGGRYRVEQLLGKGGFGRVYRAFDEMLGRSIALKLFLTERRAGQTDANEEFLREARTVAKLEHPGIVPVYDAGLHEGAPWMAVRLVQGSDLRGVLDREGRLAPARAFELLRQAAEALGHAHKKGIVHRDVKPHNLLLEPAEGGGERLWVTDFGIAKLITGHTTEHERSISGTPHYMSPEQISGRRVDARSDLFSLGCVAYELLTGSRAFQGDSFAELLYAIVHGATPTTPELDAFLRKALAKSPDDRYQTAAELAEALRMAAAGGPAPQPRPGLWARLRRVEPPWDGKLAVRAEGLVKSYGFGRKVLRGLDLAVPRGAIYAVLGRNGSGKSTLLRTCLGLYRPERGTVRLFGRDPARHGPAVLARTGYVPESVALYDWMSVAELLRFLPRFYPKTWDTAYTYRLLERFGLPLDAPIKSLSRGGQTQASLIAALGHRPELLILDDPTLGLDAVILDQFVLTLEEASRRDGTTILIASHHLAELDRLATHVAFLKDGVVAEADTLPNLKRRAAAASLKELFVRSLGPTA